MVYIKKTEQYFWIFLILAITLGFIFPTFFQQFEGLVIYIIMIIMGLLFLKVDIVDIITHLKKPSLILYVAFVKLIVLPTVVFFLFKQANPNVQIGIFLLAALPTGVSSAAFTDIMKGRTSLNLSTIIVTNLLSIFTIPVLFLIFFNTTLQIDHMALFINLSKIIFIPLVIAKIIKRTIVPDIITSIQSYLNIKIILLLSFMIMISISFQAEEILATLPDQIKTLLLLFSAFIVFQGIGYYCVSWKNKGEKLAVSNSCMIMNNILGIVLALAFFEKEVLTIVLLSLIPWNSMIIAKHWYKRYLP